MTLQPGVQAEYHIQQDELVPFVFDFGPALRDASNTLVDTVSSVAVTHTTGIAVSGTPSLTSTTVRVLVDASGMSSGATVYIILVVATTAGGAKRNFAIQILIDPKATI